MTKELKNCPFCDSDDIGYRCDYINDAYWIYWMECYNCYARGPERYVDGEEVFAWNTRHEPVPNWLKTELEHEIFLLEVVKGVVKTQSAMRDVEIAINRYKTVLSLKPPEHR
jgi:hypothetical protein